MGSPTSVMAVDVGGTSGWCAVRLPNFEATVGQVKDVDTLLCVLETHKPEVVIVEDFRLYPEQAKSLSRQRLYIGETIGMIALWCERNQVELIRQSASMGKVITRELLERLGLWSLTRNMPHARDAARHLVVWLLRQGNKELTNRVFKGESA